MENFLKIENVFDGENITCEIEPVMISVYSDLDEKIASLETEVARINNEQKKYTADLDWIDYTVAAGSGLLCSILGSIFVGKFSLEEASLWGSEKTNQFVKHVAKSQGYNGTDDSLNGAIKFLSDKFHLASDSNRNDFGGGLQHHLRDFSHHPTPVGLIFSLLTQFTKKSYGTNVSGSFIVVPVRDLIYIGKDIPQKILFGLVYWFFHMVSDMAGSGSNSIGTGIPGPLGSLLKELSSLPLFKKVNDKGYKEFSVWVSKLFNGTRFYSADGKPIKFDLRTEIGIAHEAGKQTLPVLANECIVRGFYFISRLLREIRINDVKNFRELKRITSESILPFNTRSVARMITVSSGSFVAGNCAYSAIMEARDTAASGAVATPYSAAGAFATSFLLRINYVGVARFAIAGITDISMGAKEHKLYLEKTDIANQILSLKEAKIFYKQGEAWRLAKDVDDMITKTTSYLIETTELHKEALKDIEIAGKKVSSCFENFAKLNPELAKDIRRLL